VFVIGAIKPNKVLRTDALLDAVSDGSEGEVGGGIRAVHQGSEEEQDQLEQLIWVGNNFVPGNGGNGTCTNEAAFYWWLVMLFLLSSATLAAVMLARFVR
jgi:hypothetical protein